MKIKYLFLYNSQGSGKVDSGLKTFLVLHYTIQSIIYKLCSSRVKNHQFIERDIASSDNYLKVPGVNPDRLEGRQRYIPITCTLSPGYKETQKQHCSDYKVTNSLYFRHWEFLPISELLSWRWMLLWDTSRRAMWEAKTKTCPIYSILHEFKSTYQSSSTWWVLLKTL